MERHRIIQILESYRPGEGLEADPEVQEALELAKNDADFAAIRDEITAFDKAFGEKLRSIDVPSDLLDKILVAAEEQDKVEAFPEQKKKDIFHWFHPAAFAAAAAIILLLALSFTFWSPPGNVPATDRVMTAGINPVLQIANGLYENLSPSFKSQERTEIVEYLKAQGGTVPVSLPQGFSWDHTFACDVVDVDGIKVSLICFLGPDMKNAMHLFTFRKSDFPEVEMTPRPAFRKASQSTSAAWTSEEDIHVLYSDGGEKNLRTLLDI